MRLITDFLRYTFLGVPEKIPGAIPLNVDLGGGDIDVVEEAVEENTPHTDATQRNRNKIILTINWVLAVVLIGTLVYMMVFSIIIIDRQIPDVFQNSFFGTLGYFGNALVKFLGGETPAN